MSDGTGHAAQAAQTAAAQQPKHCWPSPPPCCPCGAPDGALHTRHHLVLQRYVGEVDEVIGRVACGVRVVGEGVKGLLDARSQARAACCQRCAAPARPLQPARAAHAPPRPSIPSGMPLSRTKSSPGTPVNPISSLPMGSPYTSSCGSPAASRGAAACAATCWRCRCRWRGCRALQREREASMVEHRSRAVNAWHAGGQQRSLWRLQRRWRQAVAPSAKHTPSAPCMALPGPFPAPASGTAAGTAAACAGSRAGAGERCSPGEQRLQLGRCQGLHDTCAVGSARGVGSEEVRACKPCSACGSGVRSLLLTTSGLSCSTNCATMAGPRSHMHGGPPPRPARCAAPHGGGPDCSSKLRTCAEASQARH